MRYSHILITISLVALAHGAFSAPAAKRAPVEAPKAAVAKEDQAATIARVESYLTGLTTINADFNQVNPDGSLSAGKFYLKRPGKMRWEYAAPTPILLVSDGKRLVYFDKQLNQVTYIGIDDTLAGFLAQKDIKLESATTHVTKFESSANVIRATLIQKSKPDEGSLTLEFTDSPLQIRQMDVVDATGQTTHVQLQNAVLGGPLDEKLFIFVDPRPIGSRYRK